MCEELDELAVNLDRVFREREPRAGRRLYVPSALRDYVLDGNTFLSKDDVTDNMLAIAGQTD